MTVPPGVAEDPAGEIWDVVVIGTGAGGATAGFALARAGRTVLFLERGKKLDDDPTVIKGAAYPRDGTAALRYGWWPQPIYKQNGETDIPEPSVLGCGTGGSTSLFGRVMDRLRPQDFTPRQYFPRTDSTLPDAWPVTADELAPYYSEAEQLFGVCGTTDPLLSGGTAVDTPAAPSIKEAAVTSALSECGLHPYRIHYSRQQRPECRGCPAMLCPRDCRTDAATACLQPALAHHRARILTECLVVSLEERSRVVREAICEHRGRRIRIRARTFILAANAFASPAILLRSANDRFATGLANSSGLVGRNLMLHVSDFMLLRLKRPRPRVSAAMAHGISLNDFYVRDGVKMGNIHAHAVAMDRAEILSFIQLHAKRLRRLPRPVLSGLATLGAAANRPATVFSTVVEDLPYLHNRVTARPGTAETVNYEYYYPDELRRRNWQLFDGFRQAVRTRFSVQLLRPVGGLNMTHACGTCRFGRDPSASVLDADNRAHDLDNLYVLDASFFPSSGGINPSLTIVANSLRVAAKIARRL